MRSVGDPGHCSLWERAGEAQQLLSVALDYASLLFVFCRGKVIRKTAPQVLSPRVSVPPCFSTIWRQIVSPRPVPFVLVEKSGSNKRSPTSGGIPEPSSLNLRMSPAPSPRPPITRLPIP